MRSSPADLKFSSEVLPGLEPARTCVARALRALIRVVSANKALLTAEWSTLAPRLAGPHRQIRYTASVGGSVPMLETLERLTLRSRIVRLRGVLNGTSNFALDRCATGDTLPNAVQRAQAEGFAEADPREDLSGRDAARKIELLGRVAFGGAPFTQEVAGIVPEACALAENLDEVRTRLVAEAWATGSGFTYTVAPRILPLADFLADTRAAHNRLEITLRDGRIVTLQGLGAGGVPTATALFADVLEHARVIESEVFETSRFEPPQLLTDQVKQS